MNCKGCGTDLLDNPSPDLVNQAVDDVLNASLRDAEERGGVCPLCGHSKYVPHGKEVAFTFDNGVPVPRL